MEHLPELVEFAAQGGRESGNLGLHLVYSVMDEVRHEPRGERGNVVILAKRLGPASAPARGTG